MLLLAELSRQLEAITNDMIAKYGEDFADNLAAEFLDEETYKKLMKIEDPEERRKAIAHAINDGVQNGTIDADAAYKNPDFKGWLDKHKEVVQQAYETETSLSRDMKASTESPSSSTNDDNKLEQNLNSLFT